MFADKFGNLDYGRVTVSIVRSKATFSLTPNCVYDSETIDFIELSLTNSDLINL